MGYSKYSPGEDFLSYVKDDIKFRYGVEEICFWVHGEEVSFEKAGAWIDSIWKEDEYYGLCHWPYYKHLGKNNFEIKSYFQAPLPKTCLKLIDKYFAEIYEHASEEIEEYLYICYGQKYSQLEVRRMIFHEFNTWATTCFVHDSYTDSKGFSVLELGYNDGGEVYHQVTSGFMPLTLEVETEEK